MTETELFAAIQVQLSKSAEIVGGKPWGADRGKPRIYLPSRKDMKVFFEFPDFPTGDETDLLGGAKLTIFIDDCGQAGAWYASQKKLAMQARFKHSLALSAVHAGDELLAKDIMELDELDAETLDLASHELINGRIAEARTALGLAAA